MKRRITIVIAFLGATYFLLQFVIALKSDQAVLVDALTKTFVVKVPSMDMSLYLNMS